MQRSDGPCRLFSGHHHVQLVQDQRAMESVQSPHTFRWKRHELFSPATDNKWDNYTKTLLGLKLTKSACCVELKKGALPPTPGSINFIFNKGYRFAKSIRHVVRKKSFV